MFTNQCKLGNYGIDNKDAKSGHMGGNIVQKYSFLCNQCISNGDEVMRPEGYCGRNNYRPLKQA